MTALQSGVDREHICAAIFSTRTLDSVLYGSLIVSCLFPSANKGTWSKGMIEFGCRLVTGAVDSPTPHFSLVSFVRGLTKSNRFPLSSRSSNRINAFVVSLKAKGERTKQGKREKANGYLRNGRRIDAQSMRDQLSGRV